MLGEVIHLQAISDDLKALTSDPHTLPAASEQVRENIRQNRPFSDYRHASLCASF